jgi:bacillithiol system protein YtxJ
MKWIELLSEDQLEKICGESTVQPVVIFKHSTRCNISSMAKSRLERSEAPQNITFYYLDLIRFRNISNKIAEMFGVHHESPQVLLIRNGQCVYDESHGSITMDELAEQAVA